MEFKLSEKNENYAEIVTALAARVKWAPKIHVEKEIETEDGEKKYTVEEVDNPKTEKQAAVETLQNFIASVIMDQTMRKAMQDAKDNYVDVIFE